MIHLPRYITTGAALMLFVAGLQTLSAETYYGPLWNADFSQTGWGLRGGSLELTHDATMVYGRYVKGQGQFTEGLVIYIDSKAGGFNSTSSLYNNTDDFRSSVSLVHSTGAARGTANFVSGFEADYAIVMNCELNGGRLFELVGGPGGVFLPTPDQDQISIGMNPSYDQNSSSYTFQFSWASIGLELAANKGFLFETLKAGRTGYVYPDSLQETTGSEGWGNTVTFSSVGSYGTVAVPEPGTAALLALGMGAWLVRRRSSRD